MTNNNTFAAVILRWFQANGRSLPWRETGDPYAIWLSEIILQQTRVNQGWAYWERFMRCWPTVGDLAKATEDDVLKAWQGLGYYSRARNLHHAAQQIVAMGGFPRTFQQIKTLKGVGDYTAAAIASIAFGEPVAVVDGNVFRVLARYFGVETPIDTTQGKKFFTTLAQSLLPPRQASPYNQGLMDFGALVCTPQSPHCFQCPLVETCAAERNGKVAVLPMKSKRTRVKTRHLIYIYIQQGGRALMHQRTAGDIWQGLWEPLLLESDTQMTADEVRAALCQQLRVASLDAPLLELVKGKKHVLTHQVLMTDLYLVDTSLPIAIPKGYQWTAEEDIPQRALSRLVEFLLAQVPTLTTKTNDKL